VIRAELPFTINRTAAEGALSYLAEFLDAHREGSIGKFSAGAVAVFSDESSRGLRTEIWLTPFDLVCARAGTANSSGPVRRHLRGGTHPHAPKRRRRELVSHEQELSHEVRKQFLQWRSLSPARMTEYIEQSRALFGAEEVGAI
jgi:hypothetical protein